MSRYSRWSVYDKTELIAYTNKKLQTEQKYICVSRPRRFGKSISAKMLEAYYSRGCDSEELFKNYKIAKCDSFKKHLNQYDVIALNMQEFLSKSNSMDAMLSRVKKLVMRDIKKTYPDVDYFDDTPYFLEKFRLKLFLLKKMEFKRRRNPVK